MSDDLSIENYKNSFSDKVNNVLVQKDTLILSLKDTINNLTNIIMNYTKKIEDMNNNLNIEIDDINIEACEIDKYIKLNKKLEILNKDNAQKINTLNTDITKITESYRNLNKNYIYVIQYYESIITHMHNKISKLIENNNKLKKEHYNQIDILRNKHSI